MVYMPSHQNIDNPAKCYTCPSNVLVHKGNKDSAWDTYECACPNRLNNGNGICVHWNRLRVPEWKCLLAEKCSDCDGLKELIRQRKASMMPNKCFPADGEKCKYMARTTREGKIEI